MDSGSKCGIFRSLSQPRRGGPGHPERWSAIRARACYEAASPALATLLREDFVRAYERALPAVVQCFQDDFEACIAHPRFPLRHRKVIRTTNLLERLFLEKRRRTKIIPHAFGEPPVVKLMYAAVIRAATAGGDSQSASSSNTSCARFGRSSPGRTPRASRPTVSAPAVVRKLRDVITHIDDASRSGSPCHVEARGRYLAIPPKRPHTKSRRADGSVWRRASPHRLSSARGT
jgi:hypothetical protein